MNCLNSSIKEHIPFNVPLPINPLYVQYCWQKWMIKAMNGIVDEDSSKEQWMHKWWQFNFGNFMEYWQKYQNNLEQLSLPEMHLSGHLIYKNDDYSLVLYKNPKNKSAKVMLLIPPFIKKANIFDLGPGQSMAQYLSENNVEVLLLVFDEKIAEKKYNWQDYGLKIIFSAIDWLKRGRYNNYDLHLASYCISGTLTANVMAYLGQIGYDKVKSLTLFTTLFDFHNHEITIEKNMNDVSAMIRQIELPLLEKWLDENPIINGKLLRFFFQTMHLPSILNQKKDEEIPESTKRIMAWDNSAVDISSRLLYFIIQELYHYNSLKNGHLKWQGLNLHPKNIQVPVCMISATNDHITPSNKVWDSYGMLNKHKNNFFIQSSGGHLGAIISPIPSHPKSNFQVWQENKKITEENGSWWPYWLKWINSNNA